MNQEISEDDGREARTDYDNCYAVVCISDGAYNFIQDETEGHIENVDNQGGIYCYETIQEAKDDVKQLTKEGKEHLIIDYYQASCLQQNHHGSKDSYENPVMGEQVYSWENCECDKWKGEACKECEACEAFMTADDIDGLRSMAIK